jgi:hypothetical protein
MVFVGPVSRTNRFEDDRIDSSTERLGRTNSVAEHSDTHSDKPLGYTGNEGMKRALDWPELAAESNRLAGH